MDERVGEWVMREELMLLTAAELQLRQNPPKDFDKPRRVYAWVLALTPLSGQGLGGELNFGVLC